MKTQQRPGPYKVMARRAAGEITAVCVQCSSVFIAAYPNSKYCSHECKVSKWTERRRHRRQSAARIEHLPKSEQWVYAKETKLSEQRGKCALCDEQMSAETACLDHDHTTGVLRGVLCRRCNVGLGFFKDSEELLMQAIDYLRKYKGVV